MKQLTQIDSNPLQSFTFALDDGSLVTMTIYFRPMQYGWFIRNLTYGSFILNEVRIVITPNMLQQYKNVIPFGIGCLADGNREPTQQQDFESGAARLYILNATEIEAFAGILSGQV